MATTLPPRPVRRLWAAGLVWIAMTLWLLTMAVGIPFFTGGIAFALAMRLALGALNVFYARALARHAAAPVRILGVLDTLAPVAIVGMWFVGWRAGTVLSYDPSSFLPETSADHVYAVRGSGEILGLDYAWFSILAHALLALEMLLGLSILLARNTAARR